MPDKINNDIKNKHIILLENSSVGSCGTDVILGGLYGLYSRSFG